MSCALELTCRTNSDQRPKRLQLPLRELAKYLIDAPARVLRRYKPWVKLEDWHLIGRSNQEAALRLNELFEIAAELPRGMSETLKLQTDFVRGLGPPLHEALGIDERSAQRRLFRAQKACLRIARGDEPDAE